VADKIDLHTHILPERWPDLAERYGYGRDRFVRLDHHRPGCARMLRGDTCFREIGDNCWSPERRIEECDGFGVRLQVLSTVPVMFSYWAKAEDGLDLSRILNDHLADVVSRHPDRFAGLGTVPLQDPDLAIGELERCVRELGLRGIEIGTNVNGRNLDSPELFPVLQRAAELGASVFVHPWDMLGGSRTERHWMAWLVGMPAETSLAICSLIFGGVLDRLPSLRIAFAHGGGAFPGTIGRIEQGYRARPDLCAVSGNASPREYVRRIYYDSLVHDPRALRYLLDLVGPERVALGSDYPFPLGEAQPGRMVEQLAGLDVAARDRVLAGTAREFLGLDS
jgi:aminocarboxymuconate-semialdehyde decarboxylase